MRAQRCACCVVLCRAPPCVAVCLLRVVLRLVQNVTCEIDRVRVKSLNKTIHSARTRDKKTADTKGHHVGPLRRGETESARHPSWITGARPEAASPPFLLPSRPTRQRRCPVARAAAPPPSARLSARGLRSAQRPTRRRLRRRAQRCATPPLPPRRPRGRPRGGGGLCGGTAARRA